MQILFYFVVTVHVIVCLFLIGVVLLQQGRSADLAGAFGGQGSQTAFGPRAAANLLTRLTTWSAIIFMITSLIAHRPLRALQPRRTPSSPTPSPHPQPGKARQVASGFCSTFQRQAHSGLPFHCASAAVPAR